MAVLIEMFIYLAEWKGFQHLVSEDPEAIAAAIIIVVDIPEINYGNNSNCLYYVHINSLVLTSKTLLNFCRMQRRVLHRFVMMAKRQVPSRIGDQSDAAEDKASQEGNRDLKVCDRDVKENVTSKI